MNRIQTSNGSAADGSVALPRCTLRVLLAVCFAALATPGCRSAATQDPVRFASVEIPGQTHERVRDVAAEVFRDHGYLVTRNGWDGLVFEREGSAMNNLAYGNWMGGRVWVRVKATIFDVSGRQCRLQCEAFILRNRGEALEEEIRIRKVHNRAYQELLDEVARRLGGPTPNTPAAAAGT